MHYRISPSEWTYTDPNPFTTDGAYDSGWSCFCLLDRDDDQAFTGRSGDGPFSARFGRGVEDLESHLADFLRYESAHRRTVILSFPADIDADVFVSRALANTPPGNVIRPADPRVVEHSTTLEAWERISADGMLKAASQLGAGKYRAHSASALTEIERYYQDEPPEYGDYVMFGGMGPGSEVILASNACGRFVMDTDAVYTPGIRLYFDNHRIIAAGLATRDGLHLTKVHRQLPLAPYLLAAITAADIDPEGRVEKWTIRLFTEKANEVFKAGHSLSL